MRSQRLQNALNLYMEGIRDGNVREAIHKYTGARYTQHSTGVADGPEGFIAFFDDFIQRVPQRDIQVVRSLEDGPYVFCHVTQSLNGGEARWVTTDLFDTDDDQKIIEHWDVIEAWEAERGDGRSQVGGESEIRELERTQENKARVQAFAERILVGGALGEMGEFVADDLIQHDLRIAHGARAWADDLSQRAVRYTEIFKLIGQGNFVVTYSKVDVGAEPFAVFDIFRLDAGRIVERWVNAEVVPADTGNSGKF